jgi:hypothetical protein
MDAQVCAGFARHEFAIPKERLIRGAADPKAADSPDLRGRRPYAVWLPAPPIRTSLHSRV